MTSVRTSPVRKRLRPLPAMTLFRPCIDLHNGRVKQIVGGSLAGGGLQTNFVADQPAEWFAARIGTTSCVAVMSSNLARGKRRGGDGRPSRPSQAASMSGAA